MTIGVAKCSVPTLEEVEDAGTSAAREPSSDDPLFAGFKVEYCSCCCGEGCHVGRGVTGRRAASVSSIRSKGMGFSVVDGFRGCSLAASGQDGLLWSEENELGENGEGGAVELLDHLDTCWVGEQRGLLLEK